MLLLLDVKFEAQWNEVSCPKSHILLRGDTQGLPSAIRDCASIFIYPMCPFITDSKVVCFEFVFSLNQMKIRISIKV